MPEIVHDRRMTDAEGLMWRLEEDPHLSSNIASVTVLDRRPDMELLRARLERATLVIPRLRHVVRETPGNLAAPAWEDDVDFDLDVHLRRVALAKPRSNRQLYDLATLIAADPFDRRRPLWQFVVVEGLKGDRAAVIQKLHHTMTDGEGGVQLALEYLDVERDAIPPPMPDADTIDAARAVTSVSGPTEDRTTQVVRDTLAGVTRIPLGIVHQVRELLADPIHLPEATTAASERMRELVEQLGDVERARSPLWTERSVRRRLEVAHAPLDATRLAAKRLGGTVNTAFVTMAAEAAGRYHRAMGAPTESLRASMAVSTRADGSGANAFSLVRFAVPTSEMPFEERFAAIREAAEAALPQTSSGAMEAVAGLAPLLPTALLVRLARQQTRTVDFATSNVKGSPVPLFMAGARVLHNYPIGPLIGTAFNLTMLSYDGTLDMGLHLDPAAVAEPKLLRRCLEETIDAVVAIGDG
jgi:WS/DGAT/MGAT family acyltransferase